MERGEEMDLTKFIVVLLLLGVMAFSGGVVAEAQVGEEMRAVHNLESDPRRPSGVVWAVQLSDLHISVFHTERAKALQELMGKILGIIHPSLVLVTGDLTDAKSKGGTSTQQYEEEWVTYQDTIDIIRNESDIPLNLFYDLRGNHDKYGVPYANSSLDYYSRYSCNARQKRTGLVQSITLLDSSGWKNLFVGVDDSMSVGLRGPSNLFGHPSDNVIAELDRELSQWDDDTSAPITKLVFGHFPTSFTASSETGRRSEEIMTKHNVSAYVCGHLHCKFGRQLYKYHQTKGLGEFWEWEMGDWRVSRMMRILAIDHGRVSFVDVDLSEISRDVLNGEPFVMPTIILPTSPLDSRFMLHSTSALSQSGTETVRVLVFSKSQPTSVSVSVLDSVTHSFVDYVMVQTLMMKLVSGPSTQEGGPFFYEIGLDTWNYTDSSATRYWLQIHVIENGASTTSKIWPFSVEGKRGPFSLTFLGFIAIGVEWESVYPVILWVIICAIFGGLLILPRVVFLYLDKRGLYESWSMAIFNPSVDSNFSYFKFPFWALLEGARHKLLWWGQVLYFAFLLIFPWFWGRVLADDYPVGYMTLWGWTVWPSKGTVAQQSGLGWPDIMDIVLPYMGAVVLPLFLMISALCAEQAACEIAAAKTGDQAGSKKRNGGGAQVLNGDVGSEGAQPLLVKQEGPSESPEEGFETPSEEEEEEGVERPNWRFLSRKVRKVYFLVCFGIAFLHLRLCMFLALAYGARSIFLSPVYVWAVPTLLVTSIFLTSSIKPRNLLVN